MYRFWLPALLVPTLATLAWLAGIEAQLGVPTPSSRWVSEAYAAKTARIAHQPPPRILIVAGSGALFGLDSTALSTTWGRPVVNMGVNAGLGLRYILWQARQVAKPGDMLLLPLEYALFVDEDRPNAQIVDYAAARDVAYWRSLPLASRLHFAASMSVGRWLLGLRHPPDPAITAGLYGGHNLDPLGDQTHTAASDRTEQDARDVEASRPWAYGAKAARSSGGWAQLAAFSAWAKQAGICLAAIPPAFLAQPDYRTNPVERAFYDTLPARVSALGVPYLGRPDAFMYGPDQFFNTDYHLTETARRDHTARILAIPDLTPATLCGPP